MSDTLIREMGGTTPATATSGMRIPVDDGGEDKHTTAGSIAALASGGGLPLQLPIQDGRYYGSLMAAGYAFNAINMDTDGDKLFAVPFICGETITWTRIGFQADNGDTTGNARVGIYSAGADGLPDTLLGGGTELTIPDERIAVEETISEELQANTLYWLAFIGTGAATCGIHVFGSVPGNVWIAQFFFGMPSGWNVAETDASPMCVYKDQAYGALPATFGAIDGYRDDVAPHIWLRTGV
jgi:hypothetical protein